jgi:DNA-binding CsgD family transcriptional regulator
VRAYLAHGDIDAAEAWSGRVAAVLTARAIPGTLPAIDHGRGLILLARGDASAAHQALESASGAWRARRRFWEGAWARLDLAAAAAKARRRGEAAVLLDEVRTTAAAAGATTLVDAAGRLTTSLEPGRPADPWHPLSAREFEVAQLVAAGLTNRQIAEQLVLAPKTISAHVTHILVKLGAARRTEIAAWCATVQRDARQLRAAPQRRDSPCPGRLRRCTSRSSWPTGSPPDRTPCASRPRCSNSTSGSAWAPSIVPWCRPHGSGRVQAVMRQWPRSCTLKPTNSASAATSSGNQQSQILSAC